MPVKEGFEFVPYGLVYQVVPVGRPVDPSGPIDMANAHSDANGDPWVRKIQANYWYMQAEHEALNGWTAAAREAYIRAGEVAGPSRSMRFNIARILFLNNEMEEALEYAQQAVEIDPLSSHAYPLAIRILKLLGRGEEARALSKRAAKFTGG
jgi:tetratricopeptide (TPR) repeat protein